MATIIIKIINKSHFYGYGHESEPRSIVDKKQRNNKTKLELKRFSHFLLHVLQ